MLDLINELGMYRIYIREQAEQHICLEQPYTDVVYISFVLSILKKYYPEASFFKTAFNLSYYKI